MKDDHKTREQLVHELTELRSQNAALKKSENAEKYRSLVENLRDVIYELDSQGVVLYISPAIRDMLGYDSSDLLGKNFIEMAHNDDRPGLAEWFSDLRQGKEIPSEYRVSDKSGDLRWARTQSRPIVEDGLFKGARGILLDVTAQRRAEEALRKSEKKYRLVVDNMADVITILDLNLRFTYVSPSVIRLRGYTAEEVMAQTLEQILTPESLQVVARVFEEEMKWEASGTADLGRTRILELEEYKKDGSTVWLENHLSLFRDEKKKLAGIMALSHDITERKRAEEKLRESEKSYRDLFENANEAIFVAQGGKLVFFNPRTVMMSGYSAEELGSRPYIEFIHPDDRDMVIRRRVRRMKGEELPPIYDFRIIHKDGDTRWVKLNAVAINWKGRPATLNFQSDITERKEAEKALRASEEWFRKIFEEAHQVGIVITSPSLVFEKANPAFCRLMGYSADELRSMTFADITHPDHLQQDMENVKKVGRGEIPFYQIEKQYINKSGKVLWGNLIVSSIRDEHDALLNYLSMVIDITEQKKAAELLLEANNKYQELAESISDVFFAMDKNLRYTYWNQASEKLTGIPAEKALGKSLLEIFPDNEARKQTKDMYLVTIETKKPQHLTVNYPGDELIVHDISSYPTKEGVSVIVKDITGRKRAERALKENEAKMRSILDNIGIGVALISPKMEILELNRRMREWFPAIDPGQRPICHRAFNDPPREEVCVYCPTRETLQDGLVHEATVQTPQAGLVRNYRIVASPIFNALGEVAEAIEMVEDITEKLSLESQIRQAQKMEAVGRLAGGVAHDFNNMLGVILGNVEMALGKVDPAQPLHEDLMEIMKAARRSAAIIRQLLAFARKQTIAPQFLDLNEIVEGMLKMLRRLIGEDIDLVWLPDSGLWPVKMDPTQIEQILANLCVNTRDAIAQVGQVTIETRNAVLDQAYCADHPGFVPGEYALLAVSDDGCGMDKETLEQIFEPFFTTKGVGQGTGLGLATVYGIVKQNNGFINVYSEPGKGTTFKVYLPRQTGQGVEAQEESEGTQPLSRGETVLVVEDEVSLLKLAGEILAKLGYRVLSAGAPGEALRLVEEYTGEIHLLMTDVILPEMNGRDLAEQIKKIRPTMKCLFMSGYTADVIAHRGMLDEGVQFIPKPFSVRDLAVKVRKVLG